MNEGGIITLSPLCGQMALITWSSGRPTSQWPTRSSSLASHSLHSDLTSRMTVSDMSCDLSRDLEVGGGGGGTKPWDLLLYFAQRWLAPLIHARGQTRDC